MILRKYDSLEEILIEFEGVNYAQIDDGVLRVSDRMFLLETAGDSIPKGLTLHQKHIDLKQYFDNLIVPEYKYLLTLDEIKKATNGRRQIAVKKCDSCSGEGTVTCDCCGHAYDCEDCDGSGKNKSAPIGEELTGTYSINEACISYLYLSLLWVLMEFYEVPSVKVSYKNNLMFFKCNKFTYICMKRKEDREGREIHLEDVNPRTGNIVIVN